MILMMNPTEILTMKSSRELATDIFERLADIPLLSKRGRAEAIATLEKAYIELKVMSERQNSITDDLKVDTNVLGRVDKKESRAANLDVSDFLGDMDVKY